MAVGAYEPLEPNLRGKLVKRVALNEFAAGVGEEAFATVAVAAVKYVADDALEHGVAQVFQAFVVLAGAFRARPCRGLVGQRLLVVLDVVGVEAQD